MLSLPDRAAMDTALALALRDDIKALLRTRISQIFDAGLADHTHLVLFTADDTESELVDEIGFSPLENDEDRYGSPGFIPPWHILVDHGGWFEMTVTIGDSGHAVVLLIQDAQISSFPELRAACREWCAGKLTN